MSTLSNAARNVIDGAIDLAGAAFGGGNNSLGKVAVASGALALTGMTTAEGSLMRSMQNNAAHIALGNGYLPGGSSLTHGGATGSLWIQLPNGQVRLGSGGFWNSDTFITTAHTLRGLNITDPSTITVATGNNSISNRGTVVSVAQIITSPWGAGDNPNLPDLVAFRLSSSVAGINQAVIGSASTGQMLVHTGFGNYGDPTTGELFTDGNCRGFYAPIQSFVSNGYNPNYYCSTLFSSEVSNSLNGKGLARDSGGFVFTTDGFLFGQMVAATNGTNITGATYVQRYDNPEVSAWLNSIPAPGTIVPFAALGTLVARRRRES